MRLQRDEFLPLRVIREELAAGAGKERRRRRALGEAEEGLDLEGSASVGTARRARGSRTSGCSSRASRRTASLYRDDVDIAVACDTLARYGIAPRHLRAFRTAADRESGLLEALVAPALRARTPERRRAGIEDLQAMAESANELSQLLFARNVRRLAGQ